MTRVTIEPGLTTNWRKSQTPTSTEMMRKLIVTPADAVLAFQATKWLNWITWALNLPVKIQTWLEAAIQLGFFHPLCRKWPIQRINNSIGSIHSVHCQHDKWQSGPLVARGPQWWKKYWLHQDCHPLDCIKKYWKLDPIDLADLPLLHLWSRMVISHLQSPMKRKSTARVTAKLNNYLTVDWARLVSAYVA